MRTGGALTPLRLLRRPPAQHAQRALLLEVESTCSPDPARALAQVCHRGPHSGLGDHTQPERQGGWADIEPPLEREHRRRRVEIAVGEPPVAAPGLKWREQAQRLPVAEHPG